MGQSIKALIEEAGLLIKQRSWPEAYSVYEKLSTLNLSDNQELPDADVWYMWGILDSDLFQPVAAIGKFRKALSINPQHTLSHYSLAKIFLRLGQTDEALNHCQSAIQSGPEFAESWLVMARIQGQQNKHTESEYSSRQALALLPECAESRLILANSLMAQKKISAAYESYTKALDVDPELASAHHGLGTALYSQGKLPDAILSFKEAVRLDPTNAASIRYLATILWNIGEANEALEYCLLLMNLEPGEIQHRHNFIEVLHSASPDIVGEDLLNQIRRCFDTAGLELHELVKPVTQILKNSNKLHKLFELARRGVDVEIDRAITDSLYDTTLEIDLLHLLLINTVISDPDFEIILTAIRRSLLRMSLSDKGLSEFAQRRISFVTAVACQCFNNEYVYRLKPDEIPMIEEVSETLAKHFECHSDRSSDFEFRHAVLCMYKPLYKQEWLIKALNPNAYSLPSTFRHIEKRQWLDRVREEQTIKEVETITETSDPTSLSVKSQYEESPYPRWLSVGMYTPKHYIDVMHGMFEHYIPDSKKDETVHVLNAGCGTGRHAIMTATRFSNSDVLAVDLSKSSLAYAKRCADERGISNISFKQADILNLNKLDRRFHIIECGGVLHHIEKTEVALKILTDLLYFGGFIMIGLYSQIARSHVYKCVDYLKTRGYGKTVEDVLDARQEIYMLDDNRPEKRIIRSVDFYSLSSCRDLLFHAHEHSYQLPIIAEMLQENGLEFLGFENIDLQVKKNYRKQFSDDPSMSNLEHWHIYESEHPNTFSGMYMMWCQKV